MKLPRSRWYLAAGLLVPLLVLSVYLILGKPGSEFGTREDSQSEQPTSRTSDEISSHLIDEENEFFVKNPYVAWIDTSGTQVDEKLIPSYKEEVEDSALVEISHLLDRLEKGDTLYLTVPQENHTYETSVGEVKRALGVTSYSGRVVEGDIPLSFLITVGQSSVFANFSTPHASYELWGNRRYALLMDYAKIDQGIDYSKPDYYLPEERFEYE